MEKMGKMEKNGKNGKTEKNGKNGKTGRNGEKTEKTKKTEKSYRGQWRIFFVTGFVLHLLANNKDRSRPPVRNMTTLQLSNRMVSISNTMGFSAVLVWYYMYKFIAKDSKMILWGPGSLHAIFIWLGGGCCVPLCAKVNWGLGINKSC